MDKENKKEALAEKEVKETEEKKETSVKEGALEKKENKSDSCGACSCSNFFKKNKALVFSLAVLILAIIGLVVFNPSIFDSKKKDVLSLDEAKIKAEKFINDNFADPNFPINIISIEEAEEKGLYKLGIDIGGGETIDSYISNDGKKFFPQAFNIAEIESENAKQAAASSSSASNSSASDERFNEGADFDSEKKVVVYFFWGDGCPHCSDQRSAMSAWFDKYPDLEIKTYETWANADNREILESLAKAYDTSVQGVPMTFIGDKYWVGFASDYETEMTAKIDECLAKKCENPGKRIKK